MPYPDSYYARTLADDRQRPALDGAVESDVCIVGGGLAGLTASLWLAQAGKSVVLLEAHRIGWGASGRNGGFVTPGFATGFDHIARIAGAVTSEDSIVLRQTLHFHPGRFRDLLEDVGKQRVVGLNAEAAGHYRDLGRLRRMLQQRIARRPEGLRGSNWHIRRRCCRSMWRKSC